MAFTIRQPVSSDASAIARLHVAAWRETYAPLLPDGYFSDEYVAARLRLWNRVLADDRADFTLRITEAAGALVGFAWAGAATPFADAPPPRERELYALYVSAAHHGSGAGQALLDAALGTQPATLWVATENPRAIAFYVRNGFHFDGVEQRDPSAPAITAARMIR
ncbi:GNAT family N-acetyltransferase [Microbacterium sp. Marseille-Q6965]|uniref:GNAT family N-acetyltransferase n=1 Tax=Microbacterium sp. Marseille-Q6965 TaxID=2965072 RepID=UPI0021B7FBDC|nr:N-acetyltransferase [Microbacterium sp. Marseille-Q6965]